MQKWSTKREAFTGTSTKNDLLTAIGDADDYLNTNQAAMKTAISTPVKTDATGAQIVDIYQEVINERFDVGA